MHEIAFHNVIPEVFSKMGTDLSSDVWNTDVTFEKGRKYLIEAASGRGKSSMLGFVYGYRDDYRGQITFDGKDIRTFDKKRWRETRCLSLSMLWQDLRLFGELSVIDNICLKASLSGTGTENAEQWLGRLGISGKINEMSCHLSFGQQQRAAFCRALFQPFDFILLDEPVSHLDDENSRIMADILLEETQRQGAGMILTSIGRHPLISYDKILRL